MSYTIFRAKLRGKIGSTLSHHIACRRRPTNAVVAVFPRENTVLEDDIRSGAAYARSALKRRKKRGPKPYPAVEIIVAGPPPFSDDDAWPREKVDAYLYEAYEWIQRRAGPLAKVVVAAIHRDENSPHMHVLIVPLFLDGKGGECFGWTAMSSHCFTTVEFEKGRKFSYESVQDAFHAEVGAKYGLERGERSGRTSPTPRKHQPLSNLERERRARDAAVAERERAETLDGIEQVKKEADEYVDAKRKEYHDLALDTALQRVKTAEAKKEENESRKENERLQSERKSSAWGQPTPREQELLEELQELGRSFASRGIDFRKSIETAGFLLDYLRDFVHASRNFVKGRYDEQVWRDLCNSHPDFPNVEQKVESFIRLFRAEAEERRTGKKRKEAGADPGRAQGRG